MRLKPWQKREFGKINLENRLRLMVESGYAKTEDEAYSTLKYQWKNATREIDSEGTVWVTLRPLRENI